MPTDGTRTSVVSFHNDETSTKSTLTSTTVTKTSNVEETDTTIMATKQATSTIPETETTSTSTIPTSTSLKTTAEADVPKTTTALSTTQLSPTMPTQTTKTTTTIVTLKTQKSPTTPTKTTKTATTSVSPTTSKLESATSTMASTENKSINCYKCSGDLVNCGNSRKPGDMYEECTSLSHYCIVQWEQNPGTLQVNYERKCVLYSDVAEVCPLPGLSGCKDNTCAFCCDTNMCNDRVWVFSSAQMPLAWMKWIALQLIALIMHEIVQFLN